jgi:hypothetical protein
MEEMSLPSMHCSAFHKSANIPIQWIHYKCKVTLKPERKNHFEDIDID